MTLGAMGSEQKLWVGLPMMDKSKDKSQANTDRLFLRVKMGLCRRNALVYDQSEGTQSINDTFQLTRAERRKRPSLRIT